MEPDMISSQARHPRFAVSGLRKGPGEEPSTT